MTQTRRLLRLCSSVGARITSHDVDLAGLRAIPLGGIETAEAVQFAAQHPTLALLYVACSNGGPGADANPGDRHVVEVLSIDPARGSLSQRFAPVALPARPIHLSLDADGRHLLVAFNRPSGVSVHRLREDGGIEGEVGQAVRPDAGTFAHEVRVTPSGRTVVVVARGNDPAGAAPEDPGSLRVFDFEAGRLRARRTVAPGGGYGFGPRNVDFHPTRRWLLVALERQNALQAFRMDGDDVAAEPSLAATTLADPASAAIPRQMVGTLRVHPSGGFVYVANRCDAEVELDGRRVALGGENSIAVFRFCARAGTLQPLQHVSCGGFHPRTLSIDSTGSVLAVANTVGRLVRGGDGVLREQPATLRLFRILPDGRLEAGECQAVEVGQHRQFWSGFVETPAGSGPGGPAGDPACR